jgi:uncharacterized membrane protein
MAKTLKKPTLPGPGLNKQGVAILQTFFIFIFASLEFWIRSGAGIVSGLVIALVSFGGVSYGRKGTRYVAAVTPPLAFAATALFMIILSDGLSISRVGVDFIAALASVAPYLLIGAIYTWFSFLNEKAKSRPSKRAATH